MPQQLKNQIADPFRNEIHFYGISACARDAIWSKRDIDLQVDNVSFHVSASYSIAWTVFDNIGYSSNKKENHINNVITSKDSTINEIS